MIWELKLDYTIVSIDLTLDYKYLYNIITVMSHPESPVAIKHVHDNTHPVLNILVASIYFWTLSRLNNPRIMIFPLFTLSVQVLNLHQDNSHIWKITVIEPMTLKSDKNTSLYVYWSWLHRIHWRLELTLNN